MNNILGKEIEKYRKKLLTLMNISLITEKK